MSIKSNNSNLTNDESAAMYDFEPDEQDLRIEKILGRCDSPVSSATLKKYLKFLKDCLELPVAVEGMDDLQNETFKLLKIDYDVEDENYGLMGSVIPLEGNSRSTDLVPLCDLEVINDKSANHQLLNDYSVWFVNNR